MHQIATGGLAGGSSAISCNYFPIRTINHEMRHATQTKLLRDRGTPIDSGLTHAIDIHFDHNEVAAGRLQGTEWVPQPMTGLARARGENSLRKLKITVFPGARYSATSIFSPRETAAMPSGFSAAKTLETKHSRRAGKVGWVEASIKYLEAASPFSFKQTLNCSSFAPL